MFPTLGQWVRDVLTALLLYRQKFSKVKRYPVPLPLPWQRHIMGLAATPVGSVMAGKPFTSALLLPL